MNDNKNHKENAEEGFDEAYKKMMEFGREKQFNSQMEKIELAYVRVIEKYGEYADCKSFVEYLRTIEKVFTEAKFRSWDAEKSKDELIRSKIKIMSSISPVGEDTLVSIYEDFKKAGSDIDKIYNVINDLLEKYQQDADCKEFILYVQYLFINFQNAQKEAATMEALKERLIKARMEVLTSDGDPDMMTLENIYKEFKEMMSK
ncbi:MAG: hypothetical protein ACD_15C00076G0001 [uncultured bacterium]|nr:MAG: hypothetical protein ACD_15C00076G0001 [uncultured bacterium]HCU70696.1 hypothetical protein [Candidatus Moranbacteria bacterium]